MSPRKTRGQFSIATGAALSVAALIVALSWHTGHLLLDKRESALQLHFERGPDSGIADAASVNPDWQTQMAQLALDQIDTESSSSAPVATSTDPLTNLGDLIAQQFVGAYVAFQRNGAYTDAKARQIGTQIGHDLKAPSRYAPHSQNELSTVSDTSLTRVLTYRSHMREALAPLITDAEPEFAMFARYIETKDRDKLTEISSAAERYKIAETAALKVSVPEDAAAAHIRVVNSLGGYASTLDDLVRFADDPIVSLAILRTYNDNEQEMLYAFDALGAYYVQKTHE